MSRAAILLLAAACASAAAVPLGEPFELRFGQSVAVQGTGLTITLADVEDSRCPRNATCVWEGEVHVTLRSNSETVRVKVPGTAPMAGYVLEVREVTPYPDDPPPAKTQYKATIAVLRNSA